MKKLLVSLAATAALVFVANSAWALSVSLDVPVSFSFDEGGTADSVSGFKVGVGLPLFPVIGVGLGYENYEAKLKDNGVTGKGLYEFYDLFLEIPFPIVNLTVGGGVGQAQAKVDSAGYDEKGDASQFFASLGYPLLPLLDVHVGYHVISAEKLPGDVDISGEMWSLGVRIGF